MKTYKNASFSSALPCVTALGCFDGVHLGHRALICHTIQAAMSKGLQSAVWSFDAPPKNYFSTNKIKLLTTPEEKQNMCQRLGVNIFVCVPFDGEISSMSAEEFFEEILCRRMNSKQVVCGYNYRFGRGGKGDVALLNKLCREHGIELSVIPEVRVKNVSVSSSEIRQALSEGRVEDAELMLGRPYSLRAVVCDGQHLGRRLGFPTINQMFDNNKMLPLNGVYASRVRVGNSRKYGITNIGVRPTVGGDLLCAETHIFDIVDNLYGKAITIELLHFIRTEQKFSSLDALKLQIQTDIENAKALLNY